MLSAQTPSSEWSTRPAILIPSCLLSSQASGSAVGAGDTFIATGHCACQGLPASQPFPNQMADGSCSSPWAACCTFHRHAPGERSEGRVPFLKALSTGTTALRSQAEGMPRQRGFRSMRRYYTVLWRPAQANRSSPQNRLSFRRDCYAFAEVFSLARTALRCCFLSKALFVRAVSAGKRRRGRAGASWALLSQAPSSRPGFTLLCRTKQTQSQPCRRLRGLAWHFMPITIFSHW